MGRRPRPARVVVVLELDPDDVTEARRVLERLGLDESHLPQILEEVRGNAERRARAEYLAEGAANDGVEWYPGRWKLVRET